MSKTKVTLGFKLDNGTELPPASFEVENGKSAYEIWKEIPGNEDKTEEDFLESLQGPPGEGATITEVTVTSEVIDG